MDLVRKVAMLSYLHALEIEIFQSAKLAILSRNYGSSTVNLILAKHAQIRTLSNFLL